MRKVVDAQRYEVTAYYLNSLVYTDMDESYVTLRFRADKTMEALIETHKWDTAYVDIHFTAVIDDGETLERLAL